MNTTRTEQREHTISFRNGSQVMVSGLRLRALGYGRDASVVVESMVDGTQPPWCFRVDNDEHATLSCRMPCPPDWIVAGEAVRITVVSSGSTVLPVPRARGKKPPKAGPARMGNHPTRLLDEVLVDIEAMPVARNGDELADFDIYLFADYSGAINAGRTIVPAIALRSGAPVVVAGRYSRASLNQLFLTVLQAAARSGLRVVLGVDHQYGVPVAFARELELLSADWRTFVGALYAGTGGWGELVESQGACAAALNSWLVAKGLTAYFWSGSKAKSYGVPKTDPRRGNAELRRLTEQARSVGRLPMPLNRIGDNGAVGGQTLVGLPYLMRLLAACNSRGVSLKAWPFDGLALSDVGYKGTHVLVELYPTGVRAANVAQSDAADAISSVEFMQRHDRAGTLVGLADLSRLSAADKEKVRFEGWILGR